MEQNTVAADKLDAHRVSHLAKQTFSPEIAKCVSLELMTRAELGYLLGRQPFLDLAQEVREVHRLTADDAA